MEVKPHISWEFDFSLPDRFADWESWVYYRRVGAGVTVLRVLGVTVRVFK